MGSPPCSPAESCLAYARACAEALFYDYCLPGPGLSTCSSPRPDAPREAMAACVWAGYEACLESCMAGLEKRVVFHRAWLSRILVAGLGARGNACMGSLLLLSLMGNSIGYSLACYGSDDPVHVMGSSRILVEQAGVEASKAFYLVLGSLKPSYLARISYSGLPDASTPLLAVSSLNAPLEVLAREASLYDPVLRELDRLMEATLAYGLPVLEESSCRGMRRLLACIVCSYGDMLVKRKAVLEEESWCRACRGEAEPPAAPAGSAADIAVAAEAACLYYARRGAGNTTPSTSSTPSTLNHYSLGIEGCSAGYCWA